MTNPGDAKEWVRLALIFQILVVSVEDGEGKGYGETNYPKNKEHRW